MGGRFLSCERGGVGGVKWKGKAHLSDYVRVEEVIGAIPQPEAPGVDAVVSAA